MVSDERSGSGAGSVMAPTLAKRSRAPRTRPPVGGLSGTRPRASLEGMTKRIAFLTATEGIEEVELTKPWQAAADAGHTVELLSVE